MEGQIIPAILVSNYAQMEQEAVRASKVCGRVQVDLCDGKFVASKTWPFNELSAPDFIALAENNNQDLYLPQWETLDYTADLMIANPAAYIDTLGQYGFSDLVFHVRSLWQESEQSTKDYLREIIKKCDSYEMTCALAIDLETDLAVVKSLLKDFSGELNYLQVMGIRTIGKQGELFDEEVLKITKGMKDFFIAENIDLPILMDGGMNEESIRKCKEAGAELFVVGSALARAGDYKSEFEYLNNL